MGSADVRNKEASRLAARAGGALERSVRQTLNGFGSGSPAGAHAVRIVARIKAIGIV